MQLVDHLRQYIKEKERETEITGGKYNCAKTQT